MPKDYITIKELKEQLDVASGGDDSRKVKVKRISNYGSGTAEYDAVAVKSSRPDCIDIEAQ